MQSTTPTELPFRGAHGSHHPDGQGGLQHGHPHVGEAEGSCWEREQGKCSSFATFCRGLKKGRVDLSIRRQRCVLPPARTCSHQDEGVSQEGDQRCPSGALWGGKGGDTSAEIPLCAHTGPQLSPRPRGAPASVTPAHICTHLCTHICTNTAVLTSGEILEGCRMQSCKAGKKTLNFSLFLETAPLQAAFPSGFSFSSTPSMGRAPGDAVTAFGDMVQASGGTGVPAPLLREGAAELPEGDCARRVLSTE